MEKQKETGSSRGVRRWWFLAFSCHSSQPFWNLSGSSAASVLPPEKTHNSRVTRCHFTQAWKPSLGFYTDSLPPPGDIQQVASVLYKAVC